MGKNLKIYPDAAKILHENLDKTVLIDGDEEEVRVAYKLALSSLAEMYIVRSLLNDYMKYKGTAQDTIVQMIKLLGGDETR